MAIAAGARKWFSYNGQRRPRMDVLKEAGMGLPKQDPMTRTRVAARGRDLPKPLRVNFVD